MPLLAISRRIPASRLRFGIINHVLNSFHTKFCCSRLARSFSVHSVSRNVSSPSPSQHLTFDITAARSALHLHTPDSGIVGAQAVTLLHAALDRPKVFNEFATSVWKHADTFVHLTPLRAFFRHEADSLRLFGIREYSEDDVKSARVSLGGVVIAQWLLNDMNNRVRDVSEQLQLPSVAILWTPEQMNKVRLIIKYDLNFGMRLSSMRVFDA